MNRRKVILRELGGQILKGYCETIPDLADEQSISIISLTEEVIKVPKRQLKALFFVRKFSGNKEYKEIKFFEGQPKIDGIWVRLTFLDNESIEGIISNSLRFLSDDGFYLIPADPQSNNRLVYVIKRALKDFRVLGVQYSKGNLIEYFEKLYRSKNRPLGEVFLSDVAEQPLIALRMIAPDST